MRRFSFNCSTRLHTGLAAGALLFFQLLGLSVTCTAQESPAPGQPLVEKYDIEMSKSLYVPYNGAFASALPDGFPIGIGSGLAYIGKDKEGSRWFYATGDRGPNADSPALTAKDGTTHPTKMFPVPRFTPVFGGLRLKNGKATLENVIPYRDMHGNPITGLPLPAGLTGSTGEIPLTDTLRASLPFDKNGLDTEGIDMDAHDKRILWACDEYGPFIIKMDAYTGTLLKKYTPGDGLPAILAKRQPNRGFEGLAVLPDGKVVAAMQSILDVDGNIKKNPATFTRLAVLDPTSGKVTQYAYPIDTEAYKKPADAKIGDLCAVGADTLLIVEQGKGKDGMRNLVYLIDLGGASDISNVKTGNGKEPELFSSRVEAEAGGIRYVTKRLILDLKALGWEAEKAEGIALLPDGKTIALTSDNDFGFSGSVEQPVNDDDGKAVKKATKYSTDGTSGSLQYKGTPTDARITLKATGEASALWLITMPKRVTGM